jgi:hypothetical protein
MQKKMLFTESEIFSLLNEIAHQQFEIPSDINPFKLTKEVCKMWFYKIGESNTDSVFMRSFTSLVITLLLKVDKDVPFLIFNQPTNKKILFPYSLLLWNRQQHKFYLLLHQVYVFE